MRLYSLFLAYLEKWMNILLVENMFPFATVFFRLEM